MQWSALRLIGAWSLVHFGYRAALIVLPIVAIDQTGSAWTVGLVGGAGGIPAITAPWWTRALQRRLTSAAALSGLLAAEGAATLVVPAAAGTGLLSAEVMVAAGLVIGVLNAVSGPLQSSLVASLGDAGDRTWAATGSIARAEGVGAARLLAVQETGVKVAMTVAPLAAFPMVAIVGPTWTLASEGALSMLGALLLIGMRVDAGGPTTQPPSRVRTLIRRSPAIARGWFVRGIGCAAWFAFTLGLPVLGAERGDGVLPATIGLGIYSGSAVLGSTLGLATASSRRPALLNALSWLVAGAGWIAMGSRPSLLVIAVAAAAMGLVVPAGNAATTALVTRACRGIDRRAALTAQATVVTGSSTLGLLIGGPLIAVIGPRMSLIVAGAMVTVAALLVMLGEYSRARSGTTVDPSTREGPHDREREPGRELSRLQRGRRGPATVHWRQPG